MVLFSDGWGLSFGAYPFQLKVERIPGECMQASGIEHVPTILEVPPVLPCGRRSQMFTGVSLE